jgi:hypothetical protein
MSFASTVDLARQVQDRWQTMASRDARLAPVLPEPRELERLLAEAFFASLEREEGRELRFVLCWTPDPELLRDEAGEPVPVIGLTAARPMAVETMRSFAPAVSPANAAILVRRATKGTGASEVAGIVPIGSDLARARLGRSFYHRPAPAALLIDVRAAGEIHVFVGGTLLAAIRGGRLQDQLAYSALEFLPINDLIMAGLEGLRPRIVAPAHEASRETSDFEWTALLDTILCVVNGVREHGHGGTVLLVAPGSEPSLPIRSKYAVDERGVVLTRRFVEFLNTRHVLTEARLHRRRLGDSKVPEAALSHLQNAAFAAEEELSDAAAVAAGMTAVDGALILTTDLRVPGFGAEIVLDAAEPVSAHEVTGHQQGGADPVVDSESFGMRHRSALRCVGKASRAAAFVVSQDDRVSLFWKQGRRVLLKRNVNTNMTGTG